MIKHGFDQIYLNSADVFKHSKKYLYDSMQPEGEWKEEGCDNIWDLELPPRVKLLIRRARNDCLPTILNLCKRGMPITDACVLSVDHLFGNHGKIPHIRRMAVLELYI